MCLIANVAEYNGWEQWMDEIGHLFLDIPWWVTWWDTRKYHMFPAFRWFSYSNVTLTKSQAMQHSSATHNYDFLRLHEMTHLLGLHKLMNFIHSWAQTSTSSGRGPCSLTHKKADRNTQLCVVKADAAEYSNMHAQQEATEENTNPQVFVPASGVRHRLFKTKTGIEGKFLK